MSTRQIIFSVIGLAACSAFIYGVHTFDDVIKLTTKPIPILFLIYEASRHTGRFCRIMTVGLIISVIGTQRIPKQRRLAQLGIIIMAELVGWWARKVLLR